MTANLLSYLSRRELKRLKGSTGRARKYYAARRALEDDKSYGIGGSTYRGLRGHKTPSKFFKPWAERQVRSARFRRSVLTLRSRQDFERFHLALTKSLAKYWRAKCRKDLSLAHRYKLTDLWIKWLCSLDFGNPTINAKLLQYGHVPIDSRVFETVDRLYSGIFAVSGRSMGHIRTEAAYRFWQEIVRSVTDRLGLPPLYFDYFAWNHSRARSDWRGL